MSSENKVIKHVLKISELKVKLPDDFITTSMLEPTSLLICLIGCQAYMNKKCTLYESDKGHCCPNAINTNRIFCDVHSSFSALIPFKIKYMYECYDFIEWKSLNLNYAYQWIKIKQTIGQELNNILEIYDLTLVDLNESQNLTHFVGYKISKLKVKLFIDNMLYFQAQMIEQLNKIIENEHIKKVGIAEAALLQMMNADIPLNNKRVKFDINNQIITFEKDKSTKLKRIKTY